MNTNSPDSFRNDGSDDLSSISSDSNSKSPTAKSMVEKELECLREKALARNVRDKYSGSHSFMSPEEAMAYLAKQRKKTSGSTTSTPPSNLTSSAEISDWYMLQRQRELEERKKREEAEAYLRAYRGSAALYVESPTQTPQITSPKTPVQSSKDHKRSSSTSTPVTPPTTNVSSPTKMETPKSVPSPEASNKHLTSTVVATGAVEVAPQPKDAPLSAQKSIAQLDAYLKSVRGSAALQSKQSVSAKKIEPNPTTSTPVTSTVTEKGTGPSHNDATNAATSLESNVRVLQPTPKGSADRGKPLETKSKVESAMASSQEGEADGKNIKTNQISESKISPKIIKVADAQKIQDTTSSSQYKVVDVKNKEEKRIDHLEVTSPSSTTNSTPSIPKLDSSYPPLPSNIRESSDPYTTTLTPKLESSHAEAVIMEKKTTPPNETSPSRRQQRFDEEPVALVGSKIILEHRQTQVDNALLQQRGSDSMAVGQLDSFLRSNRGLLPPFDEGKPNHHNSTVNNGEKSQMSIDSAFSVPVPSPLAAVRSQSSLTATSSLSTDSIIPSLGKKSSTDALNVDTSWNDRSAPYDSDHHYVDLLKDDVPVSVEKHHSLDLSLVTPNVARNPNTSFSDLSKDISSTSSSYRLESHNRANMLKYSSPACADEFTPTFEKRSDMRRLSEDVIGSREYMKSTLKLLDSASFQNDPMDLLAQDVDEEEDRYGSFQLGENIMGRNIWTEPSDDRSLDGGCSVLTSTSTSSKSLSQTTEYRSSSAFQRLVQQQKEKYERRLKTRAEEHLEQIDEIIQQLNNIEAKYQTDISNLRGSLTVKESNVVSLNAYISQARLKNANLRDEAVQQQAGYSAQKFEYDGVFKIQKDLETVIQGVQNEIKKTLAQREKLISEAIRSAQEEIKIAAEKQFAQSNIAFIQLKKDLAVVEDEKKVWAKRAEEASSKLDDVNSNSNRRIDDLLNQVNKSKEELEFSKTDISRMRQELVNERTVFTERVENMTRDVARLGKECTEAHQLAQTIELEKNHLKQEADELKALSDELMTLVAG